VNLDITVYGEPKPQGSKRGFVTKTGKVALVEQAGKPLKDWRNAVTLTAAYLAEQQQWQRTTKPVSVDIEFRLPRPQKPRYPLPAVRPDLDKLIRSVLDSITAAHNIWNDDSQACRILATKIYTPPEMNGVRIVLTTM
jgi:Holliday junction resolvase RusA-like endonuclease